MNKNPFWFCPIALLFFLRESCLEVWGDHEARDVWGVITSVPFLMQPLEELVHPRGEKLEEQGVFLLPCLLPGEGTKIGHHDLCQAYQGATQSPSLLWDLAWGHKVSSFGRKIIWQSYFFASPKLTSELTKLCLY